MAKPVQLRFHRKGAAAASADITRGVSTVRLKLDLGQGRNLSLSMTAATARDLSHVLTSACFDVETNKSSSEDPAPEVSGGRGAASAS